MDKEQLIEKYKNFITREKLEGVINRHQLFSEGYDSVIILSDIKIDNIDYDVFLAVKNHIFYGIIGNNYSQSNKNLKIIPKYTGQLFIVLK